MKRTPETDYDLISIGRCGVDLYSNQLGGGLEDALSFNKYVGGCPANIAIGTSRLGLRVAMVSRVGKEQMGEYLIKTFACEGVDTRFIRRDDKRLTTLVLLSIRDSQTFPLLYYRKDCADMGLCREDIPVEAIGKSKAILLSGVHLSAPETAQALFKAAEAARAAGTRIIFDIDYRPVLWGLTDLGEGENRFVANREVTQNIQKILPMCDLIVGTDEEFNIAGGSEDPYASLKNVRALTDATLVFKMGALGCCVIDDGEVPAKFSPNGRSFKVGIVNTVGAGDAFMSGFLSAYLRGEDWETCATKGNASGALVVSRHGCSPESPSVPELDYFMSRRDQLPAIPDHAPAFRRLHNATTGQHRPGAGDAGAGDFCILAFDHRLQFEEMAAKAGLSPADAAIAEGKKLIWQAFVMAKKNITTEKSLKPGLICDGRYGEDVLRQATGLGGDIGLAGEPIWIARPVEKPKSYPLEFDFSEPIAHVVESFPASHLVKCLFFYKSDEEAHLRALQLKRVWQLYRACEHSRHRLLLEILPRDPLAAREEGEEVLRGMEEVYKRDIFPDWWKLPGLSAGHWDDVRSVINRGDPHCCGVLLLGKDKPIEDLQKDIEIAARQPECRGFAVGRSIFGAPILSWFQKETDADETVRVISENFLRLTDIWTGARPAEHAARRRR